MLSRSEIEELAALRRRAYSAGASELNAEALNRLAELEASARDTGVTAHDRREMDETVEAGTPADPRDPEARAQGDAGLWRRSRAWLTPVLVASGFAVGVLAGSQPEWLTEMFTPKNSLDERVLSVEQKASYDRVTATQRWDVSEDVGLAAATTELTAWTGTMAGGEKYCVAIDELSVTTLLCQPADRSDAYPLRFEWVSSNSGYSLYLDVDGDGATTATVESPG